MARNMARWRPAKWTPKIGASSDGDSKLSTIPTEYVTFAGAGFLGGLLISKRVGASLGVSPAMGTGILSGMTIGVGFGLAHGGIISDKTWKQVLSLGLGLVGATAFQILQGILDPLVLTPEVTPTKTP